MAEIDKTKDDTKNICWGRGDTDPKVFTITDDAKPPVVVDVSGWTFKLTVNSDKEPTDQSTEQFSINGAFVTDGTDGKVKFTPAPGDTDIPADKYFYDVERKIAGVSIKTLVKGECEIVQDITKV